MGKRLSRQLKLQGGISGMKNRKLRELMDSPGLIVAPGVGDAIAARLVQKTGFDVCYMTGNGAVGSMIGKPDIGLATMTEMVQRAHNIVSCLDIPLISDADTGYGGINNVKRTVQEFEAAGVSAIHIEDQGLPKKCGAMEGIELLPTEQVMEKIQIATKSRKDPDFLIIARTDSRKILGLEESLNRAKSFAKAGADVVYVEMLENKEEILKLTTSVDTPVLYDMLEMTRDRIYTNKELESLGVKIVIYSLSTTFYAANKVKHLLEVLKETGTTVSLFDEMMHLHDYEKLMGLEEENNIRELLG
jgi:2-methylisocitrate lyase-like PEP mutase family enzyme